ncbi:hypothetical protein B9Q08_02420 [Candidatus Marsarchaeota G2 archaeon ECH_B_SAG-M15]|uniref:Uncharacterized protein n=1 Tax=Candidatus Marsarchaeota G2 archaeon ECH_B_SAG-M15 TaxID=1978162 RepID=A0A2R6AZ48_9ARCH|nr:MAG: hypothetical protein B9Q08_02420 [Candidatus Marsarchaeota G2 archaeon ECH_B_SAG-M15]
MAWLGLAWLGLAWLGLAWLGGLLFSLSSLLCLFCLSFLLSLFFSFLFSFSSLSSLSSLSSSPRRLDFPLPLPLLPSSFPCFFSPSPPCFLSCFVSPFLFYSLHSPPLPPPPLPPPTSDGSEGLPGEQAASPHKHYYDYDTHVNHHDLSLNSTMFSTTSRGLHKASQTGKQ